MKNQKQKSVSIFMLIDALGWDYIKDRDFLPEIAQTKRPVKSTLGFSSGVIPSILTGKMPQAHKHWSLYFYSPQASPFKWTQMLHWLPKRILNSRLSREIVEQISKRVMGYTGYFETYLIPVELLYLYDISEHKKIYAPAGMRNAPSIFDILKERKVNYHCLTYPVKDADIFEKARQALQETDKDFYFLYFSESDAYLHRDCKNTQGVNAMIDRYEKNITNLYQTAHDSFETVNLYIFSDHSMAPVYESFDLKAEIDALNFQMPGDYACFYDSTMARFWFFNDQAKEGIENILHTKDYGRILTETDKKRLGIDFKDSMYGETIFLMNTGCVINPSHMGHKPPQGMHGYNVDDGAMDAILVSNCEVKEEIRDVRDFFGIMMNEITND
jgi:hypothetical protein